MATLDHLIVRVNDLDASLAFNTCVLGFADEGRDGPFAMLRVGPDRQLLLAPWGTGGSEHYAFGGARGLAPTLYFLDPDKHLLEIRTYDHREPETL